MKKQVELRPIKERPSDYDEIEKRLKEFFRTEIYEPIIRELDLSNEKILIQNESGDALSKALQSGRIVYSHGKFYGKLNSEITQDLRDIGATWDRSQKMFMLPPDEVPMRIKSAISSSEASFQKRLSRIDRKLAQISPAEISGKIKVENLFDKALWRVEKDFEKTLKNITIVPKFTEEQRQILAHKWQNNMELWIQDFTSNEIVKLRKQIQQSTLSGNRYENVVSSIQQSYGVSANKAKFLAKQETSLLVSQYKEMRYVEAGVPRYRWGCVSGSKDHPVRPWHKALQGKIFRWDDPPITTEPGTAPRRNNPGQDYNCRCFAIPIVNFKSDD